MSSHGIHDGWPFPPAPAGSYTGPLFPFSFVSVLLVRSRADRRLHLQDTEV